FYYEHLLARYLHSLPTRRSSDLTNPNDGELLADTFFEYMKTHVPSPKTHRFYFDYGTETLDKHYPKYAQRVNTIFKDKGYDPSRSEEHTSELQSRENLVCRLLLE